MVRRDTWGISEVFMIFNFLNWVVDTLSLLLVFTLHINIIRAHLEKQKKQERKEEIIYVGETEVTSALFHLTRER